MTHLLNSRLIIQCKIIGCAVILYLEFKNRKIKAGTWYTDDGKGRAWATQVRDALCSHGSTDAG